MADHRPFRQHVKQTGVSPVSFVSFQEGRCTVHILGTPQFHTRHINVKMTKPIRRPDVTATAMLPYLWMEGTSTYPSALEIIRRSDTLFGTVLQTGVGKRGSRQMVEAYAGFAAAKADDTLFSDVLALVLEIMFDPATVDGTFPEGHVERQRVLHQKRIASVYDDKIQYAYERCMAEVARGRPESLPRLGFTEDLKDCTGARLWQAYQDLCDEADIHVYVVGPISDAEAEAKIILGRINAAFTRLSTRAPESESVVQALPVRAGQERQVVDEQSVVQGKLNLGIRTGISYKDESYPALLVANGILGGFPHSKLFRNVREKASLAYYASSRLDALTGVISVQTGIEVANYDRVLAIIKEQIQALRNGDVDENELDYTKRGLRNQYQVMLDQPMTMADQHFVGVLAGNPRSIPELLTAIDQVTPADVAQVAANWTVDIVYFLKGRVQTSA
ncbi:MAG: insulinase family protein [Alicyclobacillus herbarius]|uniref:EF-P 5-aminopentanol modification-associated protein YfmF n=1 Tax=Alicyclobacillus herbarius TaxID=122960 RepID=UPI0023530608|nr:pitrilysin family protein [Alicyclobacillus herbarius]MCL6631547.1 insulinase family protein [Alicyclobacillus herbarius]